MIYSDNSFSFDIPCEDEGGCIKRDFYFLKDFFFSVGTEWSLLIEFIQVSTLIEGWAWSGPDPSYHWSMRPISDEPQIYWPEFCQTERKASWKADTYTVYLSTLTNTLPCFLVNIEVAYRNGYSFVTEGHPWTKKEKYLFIWSLLPR